MSFKFEVGHFSLLTFLKDILAF